MRYMLDTCAFIDSLTDPEMLGQDVCALMEDYENVFYISQETIREVILKYKTKHVWSKVWKTAEDIVDYIYNECQFIVDPIIRCRYDCVWLDEHLRHIKDERIKRQSRASDSPKF